MKNFTEIEDLLDDPIWVKLILLAFVILLWLSSIITSVQT